ncbi:hypothetical protein AB0L40_01695 [Patulibacter sp. NPDC049589]|uniref:hypothetical protein n=1 Tax=Patulibacter sp. NPDC049589 TaxID=3154731 RepID=UPI00341E6550
MDGPLHRVPLEQGGLRKGLHSRDPAFQALPDDFRQRLDPPPQGLLDAATASGEIRSGVDAADLLHPVASLNRPADGGGDGRRMVALLVDGVYFGARRRSAGPEQR